MSNLFQFAFIITAYYNTEEANTLFSFHNIQDPVYLSEGKRRSSYTKHGTLAGHRTTEGKVLLFYIRLKS